MNKIKFSIVIPTRQRHETLGAAIKTVLNQPYSNFELIISDNYSTIETSEVVSQFHDNRLRYFRTPQVLSMSNNWEFALSKVAGDYVILFGDDDGLMPYALTDLADLINAHGFEVIRWERIYYSWPNIVPECYANMLTIHLLNVNRVISSDSVIYPVAKGSVAYTKLPELYNSAVKVSFLSEMKQKTGRIFHSIIPDIYSGFSLAFLAKKYLSVGKPMTINGGSEKSNGTNFFFSENNIISKEFVSDELNQDFHFHERVPLVKNLYTHIIEPYLRFQEQYSRYGNIKNVSRRRIFKNILNNIIVYSQDDLEHSIRLIKQAFEYELRTDGWYGNYLRKTKYQVSEKPVEPYQTGITDTKAIFNAAKLGAFNVFDVSVLCNKIIGSLSYDLKINKPVVQRIQPSIIKIIKQLIPRF